MGYQDNQRKIFTKVEIAFAESEISRDIETTESGNSTISHPREVAGSSISPTVKACTMDGNSVMDGSFQMVDDTCVVGWWSGALSSSTGRFIESTFIELTFLSRPVTKWTITGDDKLNQYPVNFTVIFKRGDTVLATRSFTDNTQMRVTLEETFENVTSIRLEITKWSKPKACAKILQFYDSFSETYGASDIASFEICEEMNKQDGGYGLTSDTANISLFNKDRKFDKGYLKELMLPDRKIKFYLGTENAGQIDYTLVGTYYSDEWKADQDSQWVKCTCTDKLIRLQDKQYVGFALKQNATLYEIAKDIAEKAGFTAAEYVISNSLKSVVIPKAYLKKQSIWNALTEISYSGLCRVFIDRSNRLVIRRDEDEPGTSDIEINKGNMFTYSSSISQMGFANRVSVDYVDVTLSEELVEAATTSIELGAGDSMTVTLNFDKDITDVSITCSNPLLTLTKFSTGVNACSVKVTNEYSISLGGTLTVLGKEIVSTAKTITVEDEASISASGALDYNHPSSSLIQTSVLAEAIGRYILNRLKAGEGVISSSWRGSPLLDLGEKYVNKDRFDESTNLVCEYNKISFDGSLKQTTRGRKIVGG